MRKHELNLFQAMGLRSKSNAIAPETLPVVNDFVDVATGGKTEVVCIEEVSKTGIETQRPSKAAVGTPAIFNYNNRFGRFRFHTQCKKIDGKIATFALPIQITVIEKFDEKRRSFRLKKMLDVQWRYAPDGLGNGPFVRGKVQDVSANGALLNVGREVRKGTLVELRFDQIVVNMKPIVVIAELTRPSKSDTHGVVSAGLKFKNLGLTGENAVSEYIHQYEKADQQRHLAR